MPSPELQRLLRPAFEGAADSPLISGRDPTSDVAADQTYNSIQAHGNTHLGEKQHIGVFSAIFIIFNRIIGTGIFATPSTILRFSGSVGLSMTMWLLGSVIAAAGMQVYIIWGSALPFNGGEKNYLEHLIPRPRWLATSVYASTATLLAYAAGNSLVFAEYTMACVYPSGLSVLSPDDLASPVRLIAFGCLTLALVLHGLYLPLGLRVQNILGALKLVVLSIVVIAGVMASQGLLQEGVRRPDNFQSWTAIWHGTRTGGSVICACLYNVIWSYIGFSNANYALGEMKDPARTLRIAGPLAIITVTACYLLCNLAYLAAVSKEEITGSGRLVASLLFRNVWGIGAERVLSGFIALSALGNVLAVSFSQGRVNQALAREGILPFSSLISSDRPSGGPFAGLAVHWLVCIVVVFCVPAGDAYNFVVNVVSYPLTVINTIISFGLLMLALRNRVPRATKTWGPRAALPDPHPRTGFPQEEPRFRVSRSLILATTIFGSANVFLLVVPFMKPPSGLDLYEFLPYWTHAAGGWAIFSLGILWWGLHRRWPTTVMQH